MKKTLFISLYIAISLISCICLFGMTLVLTFMQDDTSFEYNRTAYQAMTYSTFAYPLAVLLGIVVAAIGTFVKNKTLQAVAIIIFILSFLLVFCSGGVYLLTSSAVSS